MESGPGATQWTARERIINPYDRALSDLIGLLSTRSEEFRNEWARHDVWVHRWGTKRVNHPLVGDLTLSYEVMEVPADPGLTLAVYSTEPGSASKAALRELADWTSTRARLAAVDAVTEVSPSGAQPVVVSDVRDSKRVHSKRTHRAERHVAYHKLAADPAHG
jgi:hypothetical protein